MSISLRFDFQPPSSSDWTNGSPNGWRMSPTSSTPGSGEVDPYDIGEGTRPQYNTNHSYAQTSDESQALKDVVSLLLALLAQFLSANFPASSHSDQQSPGSSAKGYDRGDIDGSFPPPTFVEKKAPTGQATDNPNPPQQVPDEAKPKPTTPAPGQPGVSPQSTQLVSTGTGTGHYFNVTNNTDREQTFAFSSNSSNTSGYSNKIDAVMTLKPGETGTFEAGDDVPGIRINTSGPNGETNGNETLYEDTIETNPMGGGIVHNPDVSNVAGKVSYDGRRQLITVSDGTRTIGDGTETGVYDYDVEDTDPNRATNPMNMALNPASSYSIVFSDG